MDGRQPGQAAPDGHDQDGLSVRAARLRAVYEQSPLTLGVSLLVGLFTATVLIQEVEHAVLGAWLLLLVAVTAMRWVACRRFSARRAHGAFANRPWLWTSLAGSFSSGALWGAADLVFSFHSVTYKFFFASVIGGLCAGTAAVNAAFVPAVVAFIVPSTVPLILNFVTQGTLLDVVSGLMIVMFSVALSVSSFRGHQAFGKLIRLQIKVGRREQELSEARERLRNEALERRDVEARLQQSQKMEALGQLAGGIAHDFNNVLQMIMGAAGLIEGGAGDPQTRRLAASVIEAADRGASITHRLLAFARRGELSTQSFDVGAVLTNLGEILRSALGPGIRVQLDIADNLPMLVADKTQLETVLLNLTGNARDAMPGGGTLTLSACLDRAGAAGSAIRLSVTDTGIGMDADTLQRAPEPFFTTKPKGQGTGLGLSMAKGFAEQSGGALSVVSVAGAGTTVTMWFPAGPEPDRVEERFAIADADRAASHAPLILLIDDEVLILDLLAEQLVGRGYRVMCADGARPALEFLASGVVPAVIISDLSMPEMDGLTLLNEIHSRYPSIPTILLTGFAGDAAALAPASALTRTFRLLRKPVSGAQLAKMVARVLEAGSGEAGSAQAGPAQAGPAQAGRAAEFVVPVARE